MKEVFEERATSIVYRALSNILNLPWHRIKDNIDDTHRVVYSLRKQVLLNAGMSLGTISEIPQFKSYEPSAAPMNRPEVFAKD